MTSLLDDTGPDLYRTNAFRVTGLTVGATARDIRRQSERMRATERYGVQTDGPDTPVLPLPSPPDEAEVRQIAQRLRDPAKRLVDELFWFWPEDDDDPAMTALRTGDLATAERTWRERAASAARRDLSVARHNLAVLAHARALDAGAPDRALWTEALKLWHAVIGDASFWERFARRTAELDDPRLEGVSARSVRTRLPAVLLAINARLALDAWNDDRSDDATTHLALMRGSHFGAATVDEVLREATRPYRKRITRLCDDAERAADAEPKRAHDHGARLATQAKPPLGLLEFALSADDPALRGAKDHVARQIMRCAIAYGNHTRDWAPTVKLFTRAKRLAVSESTAADIDRNLAVAEENVRQATCLFCDRPATDAGALPWKLSGDTGFTGRQYTWHIRTVPIPRCPKCRSRHVLRARLIELGWATVLIAAVAGLWALAGPAVTVCVLFGIGVACLRELGNLKRFLGSKLGMAGVPRRQRDKIDLYPPIRKLRIEGWRYGLKPYKVP